MSNTKSLLGPKAIFWAALAWTLLITVLCLISSDSLNDAGRFDIPYMDKYVHFIFYFVFTVLWFLAFRKSDAGAQRARGLAFMLALGYGAMIEGLQGLFTWHRSADIADVFANAAGSAVAVLAIWLLSKKK